MNIGLVDIDGHAKKKKWGATVYSSPAKVSGVSGT